MGYLSNFIVYLFAMIGIIIFALYVYKQFNVGSYSSKRSNMLCVEDTLSLSPRKTLFVIKEGSQRFLIASDADRTTLIAELEKSPAQPSLRNNSRSVRIADLSDEAVAAQGNAAPCVRPILKEIKKRMKF